MKRILLLCLALGLLSGCSSLFAAEPVTAEFYAMDTVMTISATGDEAKAAVAAAESEINRLDALLSIGNSASEVTAVNENGEGTLSDDTAAIIEESIKIYKETDGAFDITVYPIVDAWGFYSKDCRIPSDEELNGLLKITGSDKLILEGNNMQISEEGVKIDLGGIAKGYASGIVSEMMADYGINSAIISLGGNVHAVGTKPDGSLWKVAIQDPQDTASYIGVIEVSDKAVITSGGYQRFFEKDGTIYHHIIDPKTGKTARSGLASVTIISENDMLADALSTALFVMGQERALDYWRAHSDEFDAIFVDDNGAITVTSAIAEFFTSDYDFEVAKS